MLDDLKYINQHDPQDALGVAQRQASQLEYKFDLPKISGDIQNIVFAGMGGSALPALLSRTWPGYKLPFEVVRDYHLPAYVSAKTLFIACSYSGNTEETVSALAEAEAKGAVIVVMAGGGKLEEIAKEKNHPFVKIPNAEQPRYAVFYMLAILCGILEDAGLLDQNDTAAKLQTAEAFLKKAVENWTATVPTDKNPAKQLALEVAGKSAVVYAGPLLAPAAYKWKIDFNENAKNIAWWNEYPEFNHNEFLGWSSHPIEKAYSVIDLRSNLEGPRIEERFELSDRMLSGKRPAAHVVQAQGESLLEQLLWCVTFGDFVTIYLGLANGVNPAPVDLVEKFKQSLS